MVAERVPVLRTDRLVLRGWTDDDVGPCAAMNADPEVMRHFPGPLDDEGNARFVETVRARWAAGEPSFWVIEAPGVAPFVGAAGLGVVHFDAPFTPAVEVGWRLAPAHWGRGYATEAALAAVRYGFDHLGLDRIVAFTVPANAASRAVMSRIGMERVVDGDFDHPGVPEGHPLRRHVLYAIRSGAPSTVQPGGK